MKVKPKISSFVPINTCSRINIKHSGRKLEKKNWNLVPCTNSLSIKPLTEEGVVDKQWLQNKKAWMISSVEEDGENLKVKMISWRYNDAYLECQYKYVLECGAKENNKSYLVEQLLVIKNGEKS